MPVAPDDIRPLRLRGSYLAFVLAGGFVGTALREGLSLIFPAHGAVYTIFWINVAGAFLLGLLLETLAQRGPDAGRRRAARLLLGTGLLGGFTTYSALAVDSATLVGDGHIAAGLAYATLSVLAGAVASFVGIVLAHAVRFRGSRR